MLLWSEKLSWKTFLTHQVRLIVHKNVSCVCLFFLLLLLCDKKEKRAREILPVSRLFSFFFFFFWCLGQICFDKNRREGKHVMTVIVRSMHECVCVCSDPRIKAT